MEEKYSRPQCCALPGGPAGREGIMDQRQYPQYPQQPGGPCPPYVQQPGMEYPPYPPYGGQGSAAPPYGGPVYGQGGGPVPPRAPQYVYQTPGSMPGVPGGKPPRRRRNRAPLVAVLLCLGLAATVFLAGEAFDALRSGGAARRRPTPGEVPSFTIEDLPEDADGGLSTVEIAKTVGPSVVCINVYEPGSISIAGSGSGIILNEDGFIVTNAHVVEGSSAVTVLLDDGRELDAWIVGSDTRTDLAVVKITADGLVPASFGDSDILQVGERAVAIGNAAGQLSGTVTQGIISGLNREISMQAGNSVVTMNLIQTSAAINPGNSGGALVDDEGKLIGINTLITSYSGNYSGVGFAIPVNYAINLAQQIIAGETPTHAQLGVSLSTVSAATASRYGLPVDAGAYVAAVTPDSGAAAAGIVPGDIVTAFDGQAVESASDLMLDVRTKNPGDTVTLTVNSGGQEKEVQVTLGDDSASQKAKQEQQSQEQSMNGYSLEDLFGRQR